MEEVFERGLVPFASQHWWTEFILRVQENYNAVSYLPEPSLTTPSRTLFWAINTAVDLLDVSEVKRKEMILGYVTERDVGMLKFFEIFAHLGTTIPIGVKLSALVREFVNPRNGLYKQVALRQLIQLQPTQILLDLLDEIGKEKVKTVDKDSLALFHAINVNTIWITSAVAKKDPKFVSYVEETHKVKFIHDLVKKNFFHPKNEIHYPCLKILRVLAKASKSGHLLGRDKFFQTLKKIMELYIATPSTKFQIVLEILVMLTRNSKAQCKRFLKAGGLVTLMRVFSFWPAWKGRGLLKMSKCVLNVYLQLAATYAGRRALIHSDALHNIRQFCESCPNDKQFDDVIMRAFALNSLTYGKHKLPFKQVISPAKFEFVERQGKTSKDSGTSSDEDDPDEGEEVPPRRKHLEDDEDDDDDVDSEAMISDIELEDGNVGSEDEDVTLKEDLKPGKSKECSNNGKLQTRPVSLPNPVASKTSINGFKKLRPLISTNPQSDDATNEIHLQNYAPFFQELDSSINGKAPYFDGKTYESIVVGLLGRFISPEVQGVQCPKSEHHPDKTDFKSYYFEGSISMSQLRKTYLVVSNQVRSVIPFVKVAYPEATFCYGGKKMEFTTASTDRFILREKMIQLMQRTAGIGQSFKPVVVYDLDSLLHKGNPQDPKKCTKKFKSQSPRKVTPLGNDDELKVGQFDRKKKHSLKFESRFEGGNLRKAIQVADCEYDLYLMSDVNSSSHNQWFYFQVSNTPEDTPITFNIVNCIKTNSQFNYGMQPVVFSVRDAMDMKPGWVRAGTNVMYYRNGYRNNHAGKNRKYYYSATFTLTFGKKGDICYIAYHYPYSYSRLLTELWRMTKMASEMGRLLVRYDMLCHSENENEVPLMTVTALNDDPRHPIELREMIFLSSRVHPGEPNSSWVMHGILHQLLFGSDMADVLKRYVFKIIPMLNVEGVINGCGRCGLTDEDLNRRWKDPDPKLHPSIFHSKALIEYSCKIRNKVPTLYCDLHGHSRRKNVFFYGCSTSKSWSPEDKMKPEEPNDIQVLPEAMSRRSPAFQISYCKFDVRKQRETTARVALWREFGITRSYTLESSYCGCDRGPYKGISIGIGQLIEVGESLCAACVDLHNPPNSSVSAVDIPTEFDERIKNNSKNNLIKFSTKHRYKNNSDAKPGTKAKKMRSNRVRTGKTKKNTKKP